MTGDVLLVGWESFDGDEDHGGGDDKNEEGVDAICGEKADLDGDRVRQGQVGRFISGSGWEIWH